MRVVCIDAANHPEAIAPCPLARDAIYTVVDTMTDAFGGVGYLLAEALPSNGFHAFKAERFRPLVEDRKSVSFTIGADPDSERWDNRKKRKEKV